MPVVTTYYHSPLGAIRISGTESYISEMLFEDVPRQDAAENTSSAEIPRLLIEAIEQLIQYFPCEHSIWKNHQLP